MKAGLVILSNFFALPFGKILFELGRVSCENEGGERATEPTRRQGARGPLPLFGDVMLLFSYFGDTWRSDCASQKASILRRDEHDAAPPTSLEWWASSNPIHPLMAPPHSSHAGRLVDEMLVLA